MLSLSTHHQQQIRTMDRFLASLDPEFVEKMFEQMRIMGVLKEGSDGDPGKSSPYEVFSQMVFHIQDQDSKIQQLNIDVQELKNDLHAVARLIHAVIPPDPREAAKDEYSFFSKHGIYFN